jgi:hypothetical protein
MNANELMLGNYVKEIATNRIGTILYVDFDKAKVKLEHSTLFCPIQAIEPIPLTEKWLLDFGSELDRGVFRLPKLKGYFNLLNLKGNLFYEYNIHQVQMCKTQYVHQLQNLYFSLTGILLQLVELN